MDRFVCADEIEYSKIAWPNAAVRQFTQRGGYCRMNGELGFSHLRQLSGRVLRECRLLGEMFNGSLLPVAPVELKIPDGR
jgi:hypothetical protein